jgi:branched-chain amino acid transport system permease protein
VDGPKEAVLRLWRHPRFGAPLKLVVAYIVLVEGVVEFIFGRLRLGPIDVGLQSRYVPHAIFLNGALIGLLYGLLGMGLVLVYRANRIINFAQAQLGSVPAVVALLLIGRKDVNYFLVLPIVILGGALLGGTVDVVFIRRLREAPRLIVTAATIGISLLLLALEFQAQTSITGQVFSSSDYRTPFTRFGFQFGSLHFEGDFVVAGVVTVAICIALGAFFRFTDMGIAVRASSENGERASLLGIPVRRVSTVVWMMAATLSAIAVFMRAPLVGLTLGSSIGPSVLLYGLAAAVVARMDSLPMCVIAGMGIGIVDQSALYGTRKASLAIACMLLVILLALLAQKGQLARAYDAAGGTWQSVKEYRPIPTELRDTTEVGYARSVLAALILFVTVTLPILLPERFAGRFTLVTIVAMVGVSLVILTGWSGQISLGQFGFAGVGAGVAGGMTTHLHADFFLCLIAAGVAGAVVAVLIGLPALRIQGLFLAVTTLAFAFTVEKFLLNKDYFGWALPKQGDVVSRPVLYGRFDVSSDTRFYFVCLFFLGLSLLAARSLRRNRSGRIMIGVRDNVRGVQAYGVNAARTRLAAFAISGFIAAVAGGLLSFYSFQVDSSTFSPDRSVAVFTIAAIGGLTSLPGAMLGAIWVEGVPFLFDGSDFVRLLTSGVGLLVLLLIVPGGLSEIMYKQRDSFLRWVAKRNNIHVPSLVSDSLVSKEDEHVLEQAVDHVPDAPGEQDKEVLVAKVAALESRLAELEGAGAHTNGNGRSPQLIELEPDHSSNGNTRRTRKGAPS